MATLHVRNVPDDLYARLRDHAEANGRSIGADAVHLLDDRLGGGGRHGRRRRHQPRPSGLAPDGLFAAAAEEARALGHDYAGTEHLLLAVLRERPLGELTYDDALAGVERLVGRGDGGARERLPFTARAKKALELGAKASGLERMRPEHVAFGLLEEGDGIAAQLLAPHAADVRAALDELEDEPPFRVIELDGDAAAWESLLNDAASDGYELVSVVERRALLRR
jgi:plasmid stability protein